MAIPQRTRGQIREDVGYLIFGRDKFAVAPVLTGSTTLITVDIAKRFPNDFYNGATIFCVSGTGAGQARNITDHDQLTGSLAPEALWAPALDATSVVEIWPSGIDIATINSNINLAIRRASDIVGVYTEANFLSIDSSNMFATLPANMGWVSGVFYYENSVFYDFYHEQWLDSQGHDGFILRGRKLYFSRALSSSVGSSNIFVQGYRLPAELSSDSAIAEVRPDYLALMAAFYTEAGEAQGQPLDPEQHGGRAGQWLKEAIALETRMPNDWLPNTVKVPS